MAKKYPKLELMYDNLLAQKNEILAKSNPLYEEREKLRLQIQPVVDKMQQLAEEAHKIEQPQLNEINAELSALIKAIGVRPVPEVKFKEIKDG